MFRCGRRLFQSDAHFPSLPNPSQSRHVSVAPPVIRTLYRSLLKLAQHFDSNPFLKVYVPVTNQVMKRVLGLGNNVLYVPNSVRYVQCVRSEFRQKRERTSEEVQAGFEAISSLKNFVQSIEPALVPKATLVSCVDKFSQSSTNGDKVYDAKVQETPRLEPGTLLLAHPLASAHFDRRVVLIVEANEDIVTGLVLDLPFTVPITEGHPVFPEVFWGHEMCQGGPFTVDMTMPPTANVAVLHTGVLTTESSSASNDATKTTATTPAPSTTSADHLATTAPTILSSKRTYQMHKEIIKGNAQTPGLFYSKVESLPSLAQSMKGISRNQLRVYWGSMYWPRHALNHEISEGLWFPVSITAPFFRAVVEKDSTTFPSDSEMKRKRDKRVARYGMDVQPTQGTTPPEMSISVREPLWEQIMYMLGGEFRELSKFPNSFVHFKRPATL
eukprot:PhF_6_TR10782/c0_g1_i1/m.17321